MTRRFFALLSLAAALAGPLTPQAARPRAVAQPAKPRLVIAIVVDQFRYDYTTRFRADYTGGIDRLLRQGAVFTNARFQHYPTVTGVGHAVLMTGAPPAMSGIVNNDWYDRETGRVVGCVSDPEARLLGAAGSGASPRRLVASTLGDEMKMAWSGKPRVIGISLKDRGAILPAGHMADSAYWLSSRTGGFVSSSFYFEALPEWVNAFNAQRPADRYVGAEWKPLVPSPDFPAFSKKFNGPAGPEFYNSLSASPYGNELVEAFAERAIEAERLGADNVTDLLTVSFSANDYVGHSTGPHSAEARDMAIRVDRLIGKLLDFANAKAGAGNVLVVFTADHGVAPVPKLMAQLKMTAGRPSRGGSTADAIQKALTARYGEAKWVLARSGGGITLNREAILSRKLNEAEVQRTAAAAIERMPGIYRVYTREQLLDGVESNDAVTRRVVNGFFPSRAGDLLVIEDAFGNTGGGANHGSVWGYDSHVPVIFLGANVKPGRYHAEAAPYDIAPTLATMLDVETPSSAIGRVLAEMLVKP